MIKLSVWARKRMSPFTYFHWLLRMSSIASLFFLTFFYSIFDLKSPEIRNRTDIKRNIEVIMNSSVRSLRGQHWQLCGDDILITRFHFLSKLDGGLRHPKLWWEFLTLKIISEIVMISNCASSTTLEYIGYPKNCLKIFLLMSSCVT